MEEYKVYSYRWVVLAIYGLATAVIQLMWTTFFSITTVSWQYYGFQDAVSGERAISMLSVIFMAGMIILSIPSLAAFEKFGFKKSVGFGIVLTGISAMLRGIFGDSFPMVVAASVGFAIAQPFLLNSPGLVAGKWFPERERATANGVGLLCSYFGMCVGLLLTPILIDNGMPIRQMLLIYGFAAAIAALLFVIFVKEKPETAPCPPGQEIRCNFKDGITSALKKRNFILCIIIFFCMMGVFNTFFTMIEPILRQLSGGVIDATKSGMIGVIILAIGIIASFLISLISDKDKQHRRRPYMIVCNMVGAFGFCLIIFMNSFSGMAVAAALYGFFVVGTAPLVLTFAAESAYPTSEGTSEGLLMFAGNVAGVIFIGGASLFHGNHTLLMAALTVITVIYVVLMCIAKETKLIKEQRKEENEISS